jgi:uncharacterized protein (TIGR03000 family)
VGVKPLQSVQPQPAPIVQPSAPAATTGPAPAIIVVQVPAQATIWIEDQQMTQLGGTRTFQSPPLDPSKNYVYKFKVTWPTGNDKFATEQEITIRGGQTHRIDFTPLANLPAQPGTTPLGNPAIRPVSNKPIR